jgi:hypothetical protein
MSWLWSGREEWSRHFTGIHLRSLESGDRCRAGGLTGPISVSVRGQRIGTRANPFVGDLGPTSVPRPRFRDYGRHQTATAPGALCLTQRGVAAAQCGCLSMSRRLAGRECIMAPANQAPSLREVVVGRQL